VKHGRRVVAIAVLALVAAGAAAVARARSHKPLGAAQAAPLSPPQQRSITCNSPSLGGSAPAVVYLPAGYYSGSRRYRVIYFLHGLPANATSYMVNEFVGNAVSSGRDASIVVAPQGARSDSEDHEYLDLDSNENWPMAIARDIPNCIDARFRTIANRTGRALIGLSAGGYGAMNIGLRNVNVFGAVESWSGYFAATDPSGLHKLNLGSPEANAMAKVPRGAGLKAATNTHPTFIGFYVGRQDSRFLDPNYDFHEALNKAHVPHLFHTYPGGHSGALWRGQAVRWLDYALDALARGA
jgi:enterochelin esterase-like enzyme